MNEERLERRRVIYSGRVQGVGFRFTTARIARSHPVRGFVQNLPNGTVELIVEGCANDVRAFLDDVATTFERHIRHVLDEPHSSEEEFAAFEIRR